MGSNFFTRACIIACLVSISVGPQTHADLTGTIGAAPVIDKAVSGAVKPARSSNTYGRFEPDKAKLVPKATGASGSQPTPSIATHRNVKIATYNVQQLPDVVDHDNQYYDEDGEPLTDINRLKIIAKNIIESDIEIVAFNEVFDENSRDELSDALNSDFPHHVDYIGNDWDLEDSGLMLFSRHPFEEMTLDGRHLHECGDVEILEQGVKSECPGNKLGFTPYDCDGSYSANIAWEPDCAADKGAGIVKIGLPNGESLFVVFTHPVASYGEDSVSLSCTKTDDRRLALHQIGELIRDAAEEFSGLSAIPNFDPFEVYVTVLGDLNIGGNPFHVSENPKKTCLDDEWKFAFDPFESKIHFHACGDWSASACLSEARVLVDGWAFDTSEDDLGRTFGLPFTYDSTDTTKVASGNRRDYVLYRGPSQSASGLRPVRQMIPQHLTIAWDISGSQGELSDHLPIAVDMLLPPEDTFPSYTTPRTAAQVNVPAQGDPLPTPMSIDVPSQMQWLHIDGPEGTYTISVTGATSPIGFDVYRPEDLSRPIKPRRKGNDGGFIYLLDHPPYYVRTFAKNPDDGHDRLSVGSYSLDVHRHDCTSAIEACILRPGSKGHEVLWPAQAVNTKDQMWFEFDADEAADGMPLHEFTAYVEMSLISLPAFDFQVRDFDTQLVVPDLDWSTIADTVIRKARRANGIKTTPTDNPAKSVKPYFLTVGRPNLTFTGSVLVSHATNLTYFVPLNISVQQEYDDSAHDELRLFRSVPGGSFYQKISSSNVHQFANQFEKLPEIDEMEDGGSRWPAKSLGVEKFVGEMPLIIIEDNDENDSPGPGEFLLAHPVAKNWSSGSNNFAVSTLPLDQEYQLVTWNYSDTDPIPKGLDPDDTDYWYVIRFRLSHVSPCQLWDDVPECD